MNYEKLFKFWWAFICMVSIVSLICIIIGLIKDVDILTEMPILGFAIIVFATFMRDFIARHSNQDP